MLKLVSAVKTLLGMKPQATPLVQGRAHSLEKSSLSPASTCRCCPDPRQTSGLAGRPGRGGHRAGAWAGGSGPSPFPTRTGGVGPPSGPHLEPRRLGASLCKARHWWLRSHRRRVTPRARGGGCPGLHTPARCSRQEQQLCSQSGRRLCWRQRAGWARLGTVSGRPLVAVRAPLPRL